MKAIKTIHRIIKPLLQVSGFIAIIMLILSFTPLPFYAYHNLAASVPQLKEPPELIVILGGSGMPTADGLIRCWYGAEAANKFPDAGIIIALPYNSGRDSLKQLDMMASELIVKGVDSNRIVYEPLGFNTRSQAVNIAKMTGENNNDISVLIVTSPEHLYRAVKTFQKAGFKNTGGVPAFEVPIEEDKLDAKEKMKEVNLALRYNMWSYLHYELLVLKEYAAITYYKMKGWI